MTYQEKECMIFSNETKEKQSSSEKKNSKEKHQVLRRATSSVIVTVMLFKLQGYGFSCPATAESVSLDTVMPVSKEKVGMPHPDSWGKAEGTSSVS